MKSCITCERDIPTIIDINDSGDKNEKYERFEIRRAATRFMWMPGRRPVITPTKIPAINERTISIIYLNFFLNINYRRKLLLQF